MTSNNSLRTRWAAVGAAVAVTLGAVGLGTIDIASADVSSGDRPVFIAIDGCRLVDTRSNPDFNVGTKNTPFGPDQTLTLTAHGSNGQCTGVNTIPTDAVGLALNITPVEATVETYLTVWGDGADPGTSALNPSPGEPPTPNGVNTPLSATGTFNIRNNLGTVDVIVDITGYYAGHDHDDRYYTETEADTRFVTEADLLNDRLMVGGDDFARAEPTDETWRLDTLWGHEAAGARACITAPLDVETGQVVTAATIRYNNTGSAEIEANVIGRVATEGTVTGDFTHLVAQFTQTLPTTDGFELADSDLALGPDTVIREDFFYSMIICSEDAVGFAAGIVELD